MPEYNDPQQNTLKPDNKPLKKGKNEIVKDAVSKGRTATGQKPDEIIFNPVLEEKERHAVFAFGRFNPPTTGHEKLIKKVESTAKSVGGEAHIIASHSEKTAKNPLPKEKKVGYLEKIAAKGTNVSASSSEQPTLLHHLARLHKSGVQHITMVAGDDRVKEFHDLIHKYNGKEGPHGHFNFKSIKVVSAGHRDPDAEGTEGISGTEMRRRARAKDTKGFKEGLPKALHPHAQEIMDHINSIKEDIDDSFDSFILEAAVNEITAIYDQVIAEEEKINYDETKFREDGSNSVVTLSKHVTPGEPKSSKVVGKNTAPPPAKTTKPNTSVKEATDSEFNKRFGKYREAVPRSGQDRKEIDLVPRDDADRKESDKPYRQQSIVKKIVDEGKKMSAWDKMVKAVPKLKDSEERAQAAKEGLKQNAADYQAILDKEKKEKNESVNSAGSGGIRGFGNVSGSPDGESESYNEKNIADADTRDNIIKALVKSHVNMHTNNSEDVNDDENSDTQDQIMNKKKNQKESIDQDFYNTFSDDLQEISAELIGKVNKLRTLGPDIVGGVKPKRSKTRAAADTLQRAVDRVRFGSKVGAVPTKEETVNEISSTLLHKASDVAQRQATVHRNKANELVRKSYQHHDGNKIIPGKEKQHDDLVKQSEVEREKQDKKQAQANKFFKVGNVRKRAEDKKKEVSEDLRKWFKDKWVRMDTKGNIKGPCAREEGEGKPKCLPVAKAQAMDKKDRATAVRRKRREDPVADRSGKGEAPVFVKTEATSWAQQAAIAIAMKKAGKTHKDHKEYMKKMRKNEEVEHLEEKNNPTNPELWARAKSLAKQKFDVYPSAYANGWAAKWYKSKGGGWRAEK